ncbi:hypothetical protein [Escherichia coli]|uniref:hypothetical protein n=1 Tax=Escherichia coli TaxID=562 RepID=UPI001B07363B|nr:hypothetical protein [Escherichia coli]HBA6895646.1 hypothetical protein [Escherichia coli]HBA7229811.1 hypothetical protein [Escherichia coli]HBA9157905.1 hypothetical protein [Escherichia coli]
MDFEFTGEETPEQLEKMLEGLGEVDVDVNEHESVTETSSENHADDTAQTQTGDNNTAPTPDASAEHLQDVKEPESKGVLTRDGKHVIPYEVLEAERSGKQRAEQEAARLREQIAEEQRRVELLTSQIHQAGMKPAPLPENEKISDEQIARIREMYPEIGDAVASLVRKNEYLQSRVQQPAQPAEQQNGDFSPVFEAMDAVPVLKVWQDSDPDRFSVAVSIDGKLQNDPAWKDKPLTDRFAEVARRTLLAFGEASEQPSDDKADNTDIRKTAEEKVKAAEREQAVPASPSDLGITASVVSGDNFERLLAASHSEAEAIMRGMTDAEINDLLEKLG